MQELVNDIIASLENFIDEDRILFARKSYPTSMKVLGVIVPNEKLILKTLKAQTKKFSGREKIELAKALVNTNIFECQHIAFEYVGKDKRALAVLTEKDIDDFDKNLDNWVSVDCFSAYLLGYAWRVNKIKTDKVLSYFTSENYWRRRIPVVATVSLNQKARGGNGDAKRTIEICSLVVHDHEDMIVKALSWALRELAKVDPDPVAAFIEQHREQLHSRVLREVRNKLSKGTKN